MASSFTIVVNETSTRSSTDISAKIKQASTRPKQSIEEVVKLLESMLGGLGAKGTVDIDVSSAALVQATGTVTCTTAIATNTVTLAGVVLTAHASTNTGVNFAVGTNAVTATNLAAAINRHATLSQYVVATAASTGVVTIACLVKGVIGNAIPLASSGSTLAVSAATLTSGAGGTSTSGPTQYSLGG